MWRINWTTWSKDLRHTFLNDIYKLPRPAGTESYQCYLRKTQTIHLKKTAWLHIVYSSTYTQQTLSAQLPSPNVRPVFLPGTRGLSCCPGKWQERKELWMNEQEIVRRAAWLCTHAVEWLQAWVETPPLAKTIVNSSISVCALQYVLCNLQINTQLNTHGNTSQHL